MLRFLFGGPKEGPKEGEAPEDKTPKAKLRGWQSDIRRQIRDIERQVRGARGATSGPRSRARTLPHPALSPPATRAHASPPFPLPAGIEAQERKVHAELKACAAKGGSAANSAALAKQVVMARKGVLRLKTVEGNLNSLSQQLAINTAFISVGVVLGNAKDVMREMNAAVKAPEVAGMVRALAGEMQTMGLVGEMMGEAVDGIAPVEEADVDGLVGAVMYEVSAGKIGVQGPPDLLRSIGMEAKMPATAAAAAAPQRAMAEAGGGP